MTVRAVILDMGMTVLRPDPSYVDVFVDGCARAGLDVRDRAPSRERGGFAGFGDVWREHAEAWDATGRPSPHVGDESAERDFWTGLYLRLLELLEVTGPDRREAAETIFEHFQRPTSFGPYPDAVGTLDRLDRSGIALAVCSNWGRPLRDLLEHHALLERFDAVAISGEVGAAKPDREIFDVALEGLGEEPGDHVVHVGDDPEHDVAPARELGLRAVLIDRYDRHPGFDGPRISGLDELPGLLGLTDAPRAGSSP